jgi:hypothetical protein
MAFNPSNRTFFIAGLLAISLAACVDEAQPTDDAARGSDQETLSGQAADDRYVVTFDGPAGRAAVRAAGGRVVLDLPQRGAAAAKIPAAALAGLANNPQIKSIEIDHRRFPSAETIPYGVPMVEADLATPGGGSPGRVVVCIIDSGYYLAHDDLPSANVSGSNDPGTGSWTVDQCGHGTHVAGTIAATANNGLGVVGVAPDAVSLHIVKVFGSETEPGCGWAYSPSLVAALDECTAAGLANVDIIVKHDPLGVDFRQKRFARVVRIDIDPAVPFDEIPETDSRPVAIKVDCGALVIELQRPVDLHQKVLHQCLRERHIVFVVPVGAVVLQ